MEEIWHNADAAKIRLPDRTEQLCEQSDRHRSDQEASQDNDSCRLRWQKRDRSMISSALHRSGLFGRQKPLVRKANIKFARSQVTDRETRFCHLTRLKLSHLARKTIYCSTQSKHSPSPREPDPYHQAWCWKRHAVRLLFSRRDYIC